MSLRRQLLLVSLLLLSLPWAGCQFLREMEQGLRLAQEQSLQVSAGAVGNFLRDRADLFYPDLNRLAEGGGTQPLYASDSPAPIIVDGYADGWSEQDYAHFQDSGGSLEVGYQARVRPGKLYLLLRVDDPVITYLNPMGDRGSRGDHLVLTTWQRGRLQEYRVATAAPGRVRASTDHEDRLPLSAKRIHGYWQESTRGYNIELEIPLVMTGERLGFYLVSDDGGGATVAGNVQPGTEPPPWLIRAPHLLGSALSPFASGVERLQLVDRQGWVLADLTTTSTDYTAMNAGDSDTFWLLKLLYRSILRDEQPHDLLPVDRPGRLHRSEVTAAIAGASDHQWYRMPGNRNRLSVAIPLWQGEQISGAVVLQQDSERYLSLTDNAFSQLARYSLVALGAMGLGLLGYASLLSWRIRSLSRAARAVLRADGTLLDNFPRSTAQDEIGELSRSYSDLLSQLGGYQQYLQSLSRKLSHELRTPIAVIQSSLDNLEHADGDRNIYVTRARDGLARLSRILTAMSEANQLEQSIHGNRRETLDLVPLLMEIRGAYDGLYKHNTINLDCTHASALTEGNAELLVQALDKLVDNAVSFSTPGEPIILSLTADGHCWLLRVANTGPSLPPAIRTQLFDSMVSQRRYREDGVHLGLGLHVVKLIAEFHGGRASADNLADGSGVRFQIELPSESGPAQ